MSKVSLGDGYLEYAELVAAKDQLDAAALILSLRDGRAALRANALLGLAALGYAGPELIPFLRDGDARVARAAAEALAQLGAAQRANVVAIATALDGARPEVLETVSRMFADLVGIADAELVAVLDTSSAPRATAILRACARVGVRGLRLLEGAARDERARVRINAMRGVAQLGDLEHGRSMEVLVDVERGDGVSDVRAAARSAIGALAARTRAAASTRHKHADPVPPAVPELEQRALTEAELRNAAKVAPLDELMRALTDPRAHVRLNGVRVIAMKGAAEPATVRALAVLLRDAESTIRAEVAAALGAFGAAATVVAAALVTALGDADRAVVAAAEAALAGLGAAAASALVDGLDTPSDPHGARVAALIGKLPDGPARLRDALASTSVDVRVHAASGLGALGARAGASLAALGNVVIGGNARLRAAVAHASAQLAPRPERVAPKLAIDGFADRALTEAQLDAATAALAAAGPAGLAAHLHDARAAVRANAALGLGALGGDALGRTHDLAACLRDDAPAVRLAAVRAIERLGDDAIAATARDLVRALADADADVAAKATELLRASKLRAVDAALAAGLDDVRVALRACELVVARPGAVEALCDAFARPTAQVMAARGFTLLGAGKLGAGRALLEAARADPSAHTRNLARATLRAIDGEPAAPQVPAVAGFETQLLDAGAFSGKLDARQLASFLHDGRAIVRANAATALGALGAAAPATSIAALLRDDDDRVRIAAARALDQLGDDAVLATAASLVGALRGDARVAEACKAVLAPRKGKVEAALLAGLEAADEVHGLRVAELICALPNARDLLFVAFDGPAQNVTMNAALGIGLLGAERAGPAGRRRLTNGLAGPFTRRREAMVKALALLGPEPRVR